MEELLSQYETVNVSAVKTWFKAGNIKDFPSNRGGCIKYKNKQIAVFNFSRRNEWYACQNACPHKMEMVVVFPAPLGPSNPTTWPGLTSMETSRTTSRLP